MEIKQFEDKNLAHYSYAVVSDGEVALIDPSRNPQPYYDFAKQHNAEITAVIETHPHADFVSSHLEIAQTTGAHIYVSKLLGAEYPHKTLDEGEVLAVGDVSLKAWNTPGHSADSITLILADESGNDVAAFTGDTLFIGDCGRPDLRESVGNIQQKREEQARQMYHSLKKYLTLHDKVVVYPAHGAGSLCGKGLSQENSSTMGAEKSGNWSLQPMRESNFVNALTEGQPFIPKYFVHDVETNRKGAAHYQPSVDAVVLKEAKTDDLASSCTLIDARPKELFKKGHAEGAINIPDATQFETWLGSIVSPGEHFCLLAESKEKLRELVSRTAKIGYEQFIEKALVFSGGSETQPEIDLGEFKRNESAYVVVDVRNKDEVKTPIFEDALNIPLHQLRERAHEIPTHKPVVVHCAGGYRSAIGSSIVKAELGKEATEVFDLGEAIKEFQQQVATA